MTTNPSVQHFAERLRHPMADAAWALDLAERLCAYDPLAAEYAGIRFMPDDRIVVNYRCATSSQAQHTFVVPKWTPPVAPDQD